MRAVALAVLCACLTGGVFAQTPAQSMFEVASVKPSAPDVPGMFIRFLPGGGLRATGASLRNLIALAYGVRAFQIQGGPAWVDSDRFDVDARAGIPDAAAPPDPATAGEEQRKTIERLRNLLADRFQLMLHPETREQPLYSLIVAKGGPKLQESTESGSGIRVMGRGTLRGNAAGLGMLALNLSNELGRRVIDKTGLAGKYTFELKWAPIQFSTAPTGSSNPPAEYPVAAVPEGATIFTALQEQLGLRLESGKGPVESLVIDRAERPSGN
jgi:bla regulator protein blaR1